MNPLDKLLEQRGLKLEELNTEERKFYFDWLETLSKTKIGLEDVKKNITAMKNAVEQQLEDEPEFIRVFLFRIQNRKQILLKARLKNYRLLEAFLETPERARQALERMVGSSVPR